MAAPVERRGSRQANGGFLGIATALSLTTAVWLFSMIAHRREGYFLQIPISDSALIHRDAMHLLRATQDHGVFGFLDAFTHSSATQAPLLPLVSAFWMLLFGASRAAAELAIPAFLFIYVHSTYRIAAKLYDSTTARWASALVVTFPIVLNLGRFYNSDLAWAALQAAAAAAMLESDGFSKNRATLRFGIWAGLSALARPPGPIALLPVCAVYYLQHYKKPELARRTIQFGIAVAACIAVAATWYGRNGAELLESLSRESGVRAWSPSFFMAILLEGPGFVLLMIAVLLWLVHVLRLGLRASWSPAMPALLFILAAAAALLFAATRWCSGALHAALHPIIAIACVRSVFGLRFTMIRWLWGYAIAAIALWSFVETTCLFPRPSDGLGGTGTVIFRLPVWSHRSFYWNSITEPDEPWIDYHTREILFALDAMQLDFGSRIVVLADHPFVNAAVYQYEALRTRRPWGFYQSPAIVLRDADPAKWDAGLRDLCGGANAIIWKYKKERDPASRIAGAALAGVVDDGEPAAPNARFGLRGVPIALHDGSELRIYTPARPGR
ncbi:MAG: glycosyltransferase family 39 protein [Planctomycetes bacterium]|nr:glycosyltransferase family 39 protein [Planctomycetota bacterium]